MTVALVQRCLRSGEAIQTLLSIQSIPWAGTSSALTGEYSLLMRSWTEAFSGMRAFGLTSNWPISCLIFLLSAVPFGVDLVSTFQYLCYA